MSKKQGRKSVKDVLRDSLLQIYRGKKKKHERYGNVFFLFTGSLWARYLDDNHGARLSRLR